MFTSGRKQNRAAIGRAGATTLGAFKAVANQRALATRRPGQPLTALFLKAFLLEGFDAPEWAHDAYNAAVDRDAVHVAALAEELVSALGGEADQPEEGGTAQAPWDLPQVAEDEAAGQGEGAEQAGEAEQAEDEGAEQAGEAEQAEEQAVQADEAEQAQGVAEQAEEPVVGPQPRAAPEAVLRPDHGPRPRAAPVAVLRPRPRSRSPHLREARPARDRVADAATLVGTFGFLGPRVGPPRGPGWQSRPVRINRRGCGVGRSASRGARCPGRWPKNTVGRGSGRSFEGGHRQLAKAAAPRSGSAT